VHHSAFFPFKTFITLTQQNCIISEYTGICNFNSVAVKQCFGHSLQTYGFTSSCRCKWVLPVSLLLERNSLWQVWRKPSTFTVWLQYMSLELDNLCKTFWTVTTSDYFAPVWIWTWCFSTQFVANNFPQWGQLQCIRCLCRCK